jgi:hypothetical protein
MTREWTGSMNAGDYLQRIGYASLLGFVAAL